MTTFIRAERRKQKLRLALEGPSGSGKTFSALQIARGLTGDDLAKVAVIDTEHGSASLYADLGPFATLDLRPPYSPERYMEAIAAAEAEGFEVLIIDSLSHAWSKEGGLLDRVDQIAAAKTQGNTWAAWKDGGKVENALLGSMLESGCHVIVTMRTKTEWVVEENEKGKKVPRKVGLSPDQRKDIDYEFTLVLDLTREHIASASKDRTGLFDDQFAVPSAAMGETLLEWLESGVEPPRVEYISAEQVTQLRHLIVEAGRQEERVVREMQAKEVCRGGLETIPLEAYEHVRQALSKVAEGNGNGEPSGAATKATEATEAPAEKPAAEPTEAQPAAEAEPADHGTVAVRWPGSSEAVSVEVGERTRYAELIANYLAASGRAASELPDRYAVFDSAGTECGPEEVIPASAWGQEFQVVEIETPAGKEGDRAQAPQQAPDGGKTPSGATDASEAASDAQQAAEREKDAPKKQGTRRPSKPRAASEENAIASKTLQQLGIVCSQLQKAGWSEENWRGAIELLTGGKRSRKELTEAEGKNVLRSLKYELAQLSEPASASKGAAA